MIHAPDVALTNFALAVECAVLCGLLQVRRPPRRADRLWASAFFATLGLAALLGGSVHGFFPEPGMTGHVLLWPATLVAIGAAAMSAWATGAYLLFSARWAHWIVGVAAVEFLLYTFVVTLLVGDFEVAILNYAPAMGWLLVAALVTYRRLGEGAALVGATGIGLTFVASFMQVARLEIHRVYFDHNALYHVIQGVALYLIFHWTYRLTDVSSKPSPGGRAT